MSKITIPSNQVHTLCDDDATLDLYQTATKLALKRLKKRRCQSACNTLVVSLHHNSTAVGCNVDNKNHIFAIVERLPQQVKRIFLLWYVDNKDYIQISEEMGISIGVIERDLVFALNTIREELANLNDNDK